MRQPLPALCLLGMAALTACTRHGTTDAEAARAIKSVSVIDAANLNDIMLTVADPNEAVTYFQNASAKAPARTDLKRGLAVSLVRAKKPEAAAAIWREVAAGPEATSEDRVNYASALIRGNEWSKAETVLAEVPPTYETYERYRLEAMVADSRQNWQKADSYYETAAGLTTKPSGVLNNWGYSKLTRGDYPGAEKLFTEALTYDPGLFTAKNNLAIARAAERKYDLPVVEMTQTERAQLLYTMALSAIKQGDVAIGKGLLQEAIDTNPQYFEAAVRSLRALDANITQG